MHSTIIFIIIYPIYDHPGERMTSADVTDIIMAMNGQNSNAVNDTQHMGSITEKKKTA